MSRSHALFLVDAFARRAFEGNAAAVVIVKSGGISDAVRQRIAAEMNQSETAFLEVDGGGNVNSSGDGNDHSTASKFVLRWFTPTTEVPLCGHATLAASHVLVNELGNRSPSLTFRTVKGAGELVVRRADQGGDGPPLLEMSLPMAEPRDPLPDPLKTESGQRALVEALGIAWSGGGDSGGGSAATPLAAGAVRFAAAGGINYALVEASLGDTSAPSAAAARALREMRAPDPSTLKAACPSGVAGVIVAVRGGEEEGGPEASGNRSYRCTSRFFAPWMGIDEDAVTGSAHSVLGPYFDGGGQEGGESSWWWARQASPRGGDVRVRVDRASGRVMVAGEATTVVRGEIELP